MVPGNSNFEKRIEYTTLVEYYLGRKAYILFQIALNICLQSLNIASIIIVAQVKKNISHSKSASIPFKIFIHPIRTNPQNIFFPPTIIFTPQNISDKFQSMDSLLVFMFGKSFALELYPHFGFIAGNSDAINAWYSDQVFTLTLGYIIVMALCIPMGTHTIVTPNLPPTQE